MIREEKLNVFSLPSDNAPKNDSFLVYSTAACGIAFIVFLFGSFFQTPEPPSAFDQTNGAALVRFLIEHKDTILLQTYLRSVASFLMFLFIGGAVGIAYRKTKSLTNAGIFAVGGAILFTAVMFISQIFNASAALLADEKANADVIRAISAIADTMRYFNSFSAALMMSSVSIYLRQARAVPIWQTVSGVLAIPVFLIAATGFPGTPHEYLNLGAFPFVPLFPLLLSIALLVGWRKK
jgi:hypothetical protein